MWNQAVWLKKKKWVDAEIVKETEFYFILFFLGNLNRLVTTKKVGLFIYLNILFIYLF